MYHCFLPSLQNSVLVFIRKHALLKAGDRIAAAVSGGIDSVALLRLLLELRNELGVVLSVVHFNHKLRGKEAEDDQRFVAELAKQHKLEFRCGSGDVKSYAKENHLSLEAAARSLRYQCFRRLLTGGRVNRIATGHTLDDQAETVLLRIVRGAGTRGLAGIYPQLSVSSCQLPERESPAGERGAIIRPLLGIRRKQLEGYLKEIGQTWREDESNVDPRHARNRVRQTIMPLLERELNPSVRESLAEAAEIARGEEEYWEREITRLQAGICNAQTIDRVAFQKLPLALRRRLVRALAKSLGLHLEFRHVEEILTTTTSAVLPHGRWLRPQKTHCASIDKKQRKLRHPITNTYFPCPDLALSLSSVPVSKPLSSIKMLLKVIIPIIY